MPGLPSAKLADATFLCGLTVEDHVKADTSFSQCQLTQVKQSSLPPAFVLF